MFWGLRRNRQLAVVPCGQILIVVMHARTTIADRYVLDKATE
jgi:hypothetical protein